jgi:hypothetical protein
MTEWAGYAGKSLAVPARASCPRVLPARPARAVVFVRAVMWEGVVVLAVREDRGRSGDSNHIVEGSRRFEQHQFFIDVVGSSLFFPAGSRTISGIFRMTRTGNRDLVRTGLVGPVR